MKKFAKGIAMVTLLGMFCCSFGSNDYVYAKSIKTGDMKERVTDIIENNKKTIVTNEKKTNNYIISAKSDDKYKKIKKKYDNESDKDNNEDIYLKNTFVTELSYDEYKEVKTLKGILVEKDIVLKANTINEEYSGNKDDNIDWNLDMINVEENMPQKNIAKIAVLDSGINYTSDINIKESINFVEEEKCDSPLFVDASGHGYSVIDVIAHYLKKSKIEDNVEIYSARVLDDEGNAPVSRIIQAINWAIEKDVEVINMSFGTCEYSKALEEAINKAENAGILIVAAAGNDNVTEYPAAFETVVSVGAVGPDGEVSEFCDLNNDIDIFAPGEYITSKDVFDNPIISDGTSLATPHVVAAAAELFVCNSSTNAKIVKKTLEISSNEIEDNKLLLNVNGAKKICSKIQMFGDDVPKKIYDNLHTISQSEINVDEDILVGSSWKKHGDMVSNNISNAYQAVIDGARYPDQYCELSYRPELHGGGISNNKYNGTNYIACYCLMIRCANEIYSYESNNGTKMSKSALKNAVGNAPYSKTLKNYVNVYGGNSYNIMIEEAYDAWYINKANGENKTYCRRFLYGIGMHILADAYAHSTYKAFYQNNSWVWKHLNHSGDASIAADSTQICYYRYEIACEAIKNTWNRLNGSNRNTSIYNDFYAASKSSLYKCDFSDWDWGFLMEKSWFYAVDCGLSESSLAYSHLYNIDREIHRRLTGD